MPVKNYNLSPSQVIIVHDDLEKELGKVTIKQKGSANGHNGIKSVLKSLSTSDFRRIRVGIDRPSDKKAVDDYVLSKFKDSELQNINEVVLPLFTQKLQEIIDSEMVD